MRRGYEAIWGVVLAFFTGISDVSAGQITSVETPGNLKPTHQLGCITLDNIQNVDTAADLVAAYAACRDTGRYDDAVQLLLAAGTYAYFDTLRVADTTSHDALVAMEANNPPSDAERPFMMATIKKSYDRGSPAMMKICVVLKQVGPPDYRPDYMIRHGMGSFFGGGGNDGLVADFDAKAAWKTSLDKWLHCDVTDL
jgi:GTPase Era involved in 16S rRNA processing